MLSILFSISCKFRQLTLTISRDVFPLSRSVLRLRFPPSNLSKTVSAFFLILSRVRISGGQSLRRLVALVFKLDLLRRLSNVLWMVPVQHLLLLHRRTLATVLPKFALLVFQFPYLRTMSPCKLLPTPYVPLRKTNHSSLHLSAKTERSPTLFRIFLPRGGHIRVMRQRQNSNSWTNFFTRNTPFVKQILWFFLNSLGFHSLSACKNYKVPPSALDIIQRYRTDESTPSPPCDHTSADKRGRT